MEDVMDREENNGKISLKTMLKGDRIIFYICITLLHV